MWWVFFIFSFFVYCGWLGGKQLSFVRPQAFQGLPSAQARLLLKPSGLIPRFKQSL